MALRCTHAFLARTLSSFLGHSLRLAKKRNVPSAVRQSEVPCTVLDQAVQSEIEMISRQAREHMVNGAAAQTMELLRVLEDFHQRLGQFEESNSVNRNLWARQMTSSSCAGLGISGSAQLLAKQQD